VYKKQQLGANCPKSRQLVRQWADILGQFAGKEVKSPIPSREPGRQGLWQSEPKFQL
jgi:hypothetical protein